MISGDPLTGRENELDAIRRALSKVGDHSGVVIVGAAGVGARLLLLSGAFLRAVFAAAFLGVPVLWPRAFDPAALFRALSDCARVFLLPARCLDALDAFAGFFLRFAACLRLVAM